MACSLECKQSFLQLSLLSIQIRHGMEKKAAGICTACPLIPWSDPSMQCPPLITHPPINAKPLSLFAHCLAPAQHNGHPASTFAIGRALTCKRLTIDFIPAHRNTLQCASGVTSQMQNFCAKYDPLLSWKQQVGGMIHYIAYHHADLINATLPVV